MTRKKTCQQMNKELHKQTTTYTHNNQSTNRPTHKTTKNNQPHKTIQRPTIGSKQPEQFKTHQNLKKCAAQRSKQKINGTISQMTVASSKHFTRRLKGRAGAALGQSFFVVAGSLATSRLGSSAPLGRKKRRAFFLMASFRFGANYCSFFWGYGKIFNFMLNWYFFGWLISYCNLWCYLLVAFFVCMFFLVFLSIFFFAGCLPIELSQRLGLVILVFPAQAARSTGGQTLRSWVLLMSTCV